MRTQSGNVVELAAAFAPEQRLEGFRLARRNTAVLGTEDASALRAAVAWGLKPDMSWADCVAEATELANERCSPLDEQVQWAQQLLAYINERDGHIGRVAPSQGLSPKTYQMQL